MIDAQTQGHGCLAILRREKVTELPVVGQEFDPHQVSEFLALRSVLFVFELDIVFVELCLLANPLLSEVLGQ